MEESARVAPRPSRAGLLLASVMTVVTVAALCAFVLQFSVFPEWQDRPPTEMLAHPVDVAVITVLIAGVWAVLGRLFWALSVVSGFALLLAGINRTKLELRSEPLYPADSSFVSESRSLLTMVDSQTVLGIVLAVVGTMVAVAVIGLLVGRRFPAPRLRLAGGGLNRNLISVRLITVMLSAALLGHATHFNQPGNLWRALYEPSADWQPWSQAHNYRANGFVGGFLSNMPVGVMEQPAGYGPERLAEISQRYAERAARINAGRTGSLADANVIILLSESFTDPTWVDGIALAENPIPQTQQLMSQTIAGTMYALSYGGGTATMEFESLTGQSVGLFKPQVTSPYSMFVADRSSYPSTVGAFAQLGHRTLAIHSYHLDMYKRRQAYKTLGFHEVIEEKNMQSRERLANSRYVSDADTFSEVLYQLDRHEGPEFINLLTMQNHGDYGGSFDDPIASDITPPKKAEEYGQYARGLAHSDVALAEFLAQLQARDEPTIVAFYGDHQPGILNDDPTSPDLPDTAYTTPFFVWNSATNTAQSVPAIGPAMLLPLLYESAEAPVPPYVALLDEVRRTVPVIQPGRTLDAEGLPVTLDDLDDRTAALMDDLRMVQYDFSAGQQYAVGTMWPGALVEEAN